MQKRWTTAMPKLLRTYAGWCGLVRAVREAHRLRGTGSDGCVKIRFHGIHNMERAYAEGLRALGVTGYFEARDVIARWPWIERFLLKRDYI